MAGGINNIKVDFNVLYTNSDGINWKDLQDLAHAPTDLSVENYFAQDVAKEAGYIGPAYNTPARQSLKTQLTGDVKVGVSLDLNTAPGAPATSFVYGAAWPGQAYTQNGKYMIKCGIASDPKYGPNQSAFVPPSGFSQSEVAGTTTAGSPRAGFLGTLQGSRGSSGVFIPSTWQELPANVDSTNYQNDSYETNNIWKIRDNYTNTEQYGTANYILGVGPSQPNSILTRAYMQQCSDGIQFNCQGSTATIYRVDDNAINLAGIWYITADYFNYTFLYPNSTIVDPNTLSGNYQKFNPISITDKFKVLTSPTYSSGFNMNLHMKAATGLNEYKGGYPNIDIMIGDPANFLNPLGGDQKSNVIKWAQISISQVRPPIIKFPTRITTGARFIRPAGGNTDYSTTQTISGSNTNKANATDVDFNIKYELFGDIGGIEIGGGGISLNTVIAPQMAVFTGGLGQTASSDNALNAWCGIEGKAQLTVTNCEGKFNMIPACYMSWDVDALMFKHYRFDLNWANTVDALPNSGASGSDAYSRVESRYFGNVIGNSITSVDRYPDIVQDVRASTGAITATDGSAIYFTTMDRSRMGSTQTNTVTSWNGLKTPSGGAISSSLGADFGLTGRSSFISDHSVNAIEARNIYPSPLYGEDRDKMARYSVPTCAFWAHLFCNSQLLTVWPKCDHKDWVNYKKNDNNKFSSSYSNKGFVISEVSKFDYKSTLNNCIIKNILELTIINPNQDVMSNIFGTMSHIDGSNIYIKFSSSSEDGSNIKFQGIITNIKQISTIGGIQINITAQDPFSLMMSKLEYPATHRIDGWPVNIAVPYLLLRTGLPYNVDDNILKNNTKAVLIGRYIMTDQQSASISFNQSSSLESNLLKALGSLLIYKYLVFYWSSENEKIECKDLYEDKYNYTKYSDWSRLVDKPVDKYMPFNTYINNKVNNNKNYIAYQRDTFIVNIDNSEVYNQILYSSHDRFRNSQIISSLPIIQTEDKAGYKSVKEYKLDKIITSYSELKDFSNEVSKNINVGATPMNVSFTLLGMINQDLAQKGGCGIIESKPIPYLSKTDSKKENRFWILTSTTVSWSADQSTVTTNAEYEVLRHQLLPSQGGSIIGMS